MLYNKFNVTSSTPPENPPSNTNSNYTVSLLQVTTVGDSQDALINTMLSANQVNYHPRKTKKRLYL